VKFVHDLATLVNLSMQRTWHSTGTYDRGGLILFNKKLIVI